MLRAIMMVMGVFFHAAVIFCHRKNIQDWPVFDNEQSYFFDIIVGLTHSFRMHLFFFVSGFSTSILYLRKGSKVMLTNRLKRIVLPFLFSFIILSPLISYTSDLINNNTTNDSLNHLSSYSFHFFLTQPLYHLWFLYYLIFYILLCWSFEQLFQYKLFQVERIKKSFKKLIPNVWFRLFSLSAIILIYFLLTGKNHFYSPLKFEISPSSFIVYFIFYSLGWLVFKTDTLSNFSKEKPSLLLILGLILYFVSNANIIFHFENFKYVQFVISAFSHVLLILGFLSLILRNFNFKSKISDTILNASYWTYLIHVLIIFVIYLFIKDITPNIYLKFSILFLGTSIVSYLSYALFVKRTFVGVFLNGKKIK